MLLEISSFFVVWFTGFPVNSKMQVRHFYHEQDACEFIVNTETSDTGSVNKPLLFGITLDDISGKGLDVKRMECVEITPKKKLWEVKKI